MPSDTLSQADHHLLLRTARERIAAALEQREPVFEQPTEAVLRKGGAFVTIYLVSGGNKELRGCIGHLDAQDSLFDTVKSVAHASAFQDYRFHPLRPEEYPEIRLEISVLSAFEKTDDPDDVQPGLHGIYIKSGGRAGLLLPQVARERAWDRETFLDQTCRKAGLPPGAWHEGETEIYLFTAEVFGEDD
jgi:AmmeMemoRadiSam system protein A